MKKINETIIEALQKGKENIEAIKEKREKQLNKLAATQSELLFAQDSLKQLEAEFDKLQRSSRTHSTCGPIVNDLGSCCGPMHRPY